MDRSIFVNGIPFKAYTFDSHAIIVMRYCLQEEKTIPSYYDFFDFEFVVEEGAKCFPTSLKNEVNKHIKKIENLSTIKWIRETKFPNLSEKEIVLFYLDLKNIAITPEIQMKLWEFNKSIFSSDKTTKSHLENHKKMIEEERERLRYFLNNYESRTEILNRYPPLNSEELFVEGTNQSILFSYEIKVNFVDIFDSIIVSEVIPFVYFSVENRLHFKIYKNFEIPESWNDPEQFQRALRFPDYLYFKILNEPNNPQSFFSEDNYSDASWNIHTGIEIKFSKKVNMEEIESAFFNCIDETLLGRGNIRISNGIKETGIRSTFKIPNFAIEKIIFSDMICNDDLISFFIFLDEQQHDIENKALSSITKNRFMLYFNPGKTGDMKSSLSITMNSYEENDEEYTIVRIAKSDNLMNATNFQKIFCMLLSYYQKHYKNYLDIYKQLIPDYANTIQIVKKIKKIKEDQKTGKRLITLKKEDPYVFRAGYSGFCQPRSRQPYKIPPSKVDELREKLGEHKIMAYPHPQDPTNISYYACEPREEGEERTYIYPGLRKNDPKKNPKYDAEVPYVPCCFSEDQYTKPGSALKKMLEDRKKEDLIIENVNEISHVLGFNKQTPVGRYGKIPHYVNFILKQAKYTEIERGKQILFPVFRYGVVDSPDSFFHCLERVFNIAYTSQFTSEKRSKVVMDVRKNIAHNERILYAGRQEFYDRDIEDMKNILLDESAYIDPGLWLRVAEEHYNCNILLFQVSKAYPYGAFLYPRYSKVCIHKDLDKNKPTVIIVKFQIEEDDRGWSYQSELFVKYNADKKIEGAKVLFRFNSSDLFVTKFYENYIRSFYNYFSIKYIEHLKIIPYNSLIWNGIISQYIDSNGKTRIILYESGIVVYVFPMHPIAVPIMTETYHPPNSLEKSKQHVEKYNLSVQPYKGGWMIRNEHFLGYIHIQGMEENVKGDSIPLFFDKREESRLDVFNQNKKISMLLQQHTLYMYSMSPQNFSKDRFVIRPDYKYNRDMLDKSLDYDNETLYDEKNRLIVTSSVMLEKLLAYLETRLLNDSYSVIRFKENSTVEHYYQKIKDFRQNSDQFIIVGIKNYYNWYKSKKIEPYLIRTHLNVKEEEPYFYRNSNIKSDAIFIVQNVKDGKIEKAMHVSIAWLKEKINIGFQPEKEEDITTIDRYAVYIESGELREGVADVFAPPLIYKDGKYAALLEL